MRNFVITALLWLAIIPSIFANQIRVAVMAPTVVGETNGAGGQATLWQSLVVAELSRHDWFALVDRDDLPLAAQEWAIAAATANGLNAPSKPSWQGADLLVIGRLALSNKLCALTVKVLDAQRGTIEETVSESFPPGELETRARALAERLKPLALRWLARQDIHTLASVLDFDLQGTLDRSRWAERAVARRLRGFLQQQPGVLVLEREQVEELLAETRLRRGGLSVASGGNTNGWTQLRHYQLIAGTISETQAEGQPLTFRIQTRIRDLENGGTNEFTESFPADRWADGVERIEKRLNTILQQDAKNGASSGVIPDRSVEEAFELVERAVRLGNSRQFSSFREILRHRPDGLIHDFPLPYLFNEGGFVGRKTAGRQAALLQAVRYLKAAMLADDRNPKIKLFLASLLADAQVNERVFAVELAEEVGWQFQEHRLAAWGFVYTFSTGDQQERYRRLLAEQFPDSRYARIPEETALAQFLEKHRSDADLTELVNALRPAMDRALADARDGVWIEGEVMRLFQLTQITSRNPQNRHKGYELQTPENRDRGTALLEAMAVKHPRHSFFILHFWSYYWNHYTDSDENISYWFKRAADIAPEDPSADWGVDMSVWWDAPRINLARRWMDQGKFADALPYLEKITSGHLAGERDMRIGQYAFEAGDYERALKLFRALGPDHKEAAEWAAKCEQKLGLPPLAVPTRPYATITNHATWRVSDLAIPSQRIWFIVTNGMSVRVPEPQITNWSRPSKTQNGINVRPPVAPPRAMPMDIPLGNIHTMAADANYLWFGLIPPGFEMEENQIEVANGSRSYSWMQQKAKSQGGLLRWDQATGDLRVYTIQDGLPHPWVWTLATTPEGLWVGTLGGGLCLLNSQTGQWTVWAETNGLPMNSVRSLAPDGDNLWVGLGKLDRGGVARLFRKNGSLRTILPGDFSAKTNFPPAHLLTNPNMPEELKRPFIISYVPVTPVSLLKPVADCLWCVLPGRQMGSVTARFEPHGTVVFDHATNGWYQVSPEAPASIVRIGNRIWCSLGGAGLAHCDLRGGDWQCVTRVEGLPFDPGPLCEWNGQLLIAGENFMMLNPEQKRFEVFPFPTPGGAGLMAVAGDRVFLVRGTQILWLDLRAMMGPADSK